MHIYSIYTVYHIGVGYVDAIEEKERSYTIVTLPLEVAKLAVIYIYIYIDRRTLVAQRLLAIKREINEEYEVCAQIRYDKKRTVKHTTTSIYFNRGR